MKNIFQDYDDDDPEIEFRKNRTNYWRMLKLAKEDFIANNAEFDENLFSEYLLNTYGLKIMFYANPNMIATLGITDSYEITDEAKYTFFLLKYK